MGHRRITSAEVRRRDNLYFFLSVIWLTAVVGALIFALLMRQFDEPIPVSKGRQPVTLRDAGDYVAKLPRAERMTAEWQAEMLALMLVVDLDGPTMMARIGIMRALNRKVERTFNPSRKDTHWGRRKLKRDQ